MRVSLNFILLPIFLLLVIGVVAQPKKFHFTEQKMGSPFNLVFIESDSLQAAKIAKECFFLVDSLVAIFSDYDSASELNKLNALAGAGPIPVSLTLLDILLLSKQAYEKSNHHFDISIGTLSILWRKSRKNKQFPTEKEVAMAKRFVGFKQVMIDCVAQTVSLQQKGMRLDLGGIAKGYVADKVIQLLHQKGIKSALVDAGGDISMSEAPPNTKGWLIGINEPEQIEKLLTEKILIANKSVATSGDVYQYFLHDGKKYAHIIDPITGYGVTFQRNVTIIAKTGADADWLATACSILPIPEALALVEKEQAAALITTLNNNRIKAFKSKEFDQYLKKP